MNQSTPFDLLQSATMPYAMLPETQRFDRWREIQAVTTSMPPVHTAPLDPPIDREPVSQEEPAPVQDPAAQPRPMAQRTRRDAYDGILRRHAQAARQAVFTPVTPP